MTLIRDPLRQTEMLALAVLSGNYGQTAAFRLVFLFGGTFTLLGRTESSRFNRIGADEIIGGR